jgi:hypothetical protein
MYKFARQYGINTILNGGNISTECVRNPLEWLYYGTDMSFINDVRKKFCSNPMKTYPWSSIYYHKIYLKYFKKIEVVRPLNLMPYNKIDAMNLLEAEYNWKRYPQKHFESRFTKFYEGYWLPTRFGYDTRRVQFSSLILTGQISRQFAILELAKLPYDSTIIERDIEFICDKLEITRAELDFYHKMPLKWYYDYKNEKHIFDFGARILQKIGLEFSIKR